MRTLIRDGTILAPSSEMRGGTLVIEGGRIVDVVPRRLRSGKGEITLNASGMLVIPGLIDLHIHGCDGHDTMDATPEAQRGMGFFLAQHGVTSYLPTTVAASAECVMAAIRNVAATPPAAGEASPLGINLEGPYINPAHAGAQPVQHIRPPDWSEFETWLAAGPVRMMTVAPELVGAVNLIEGGLARGVAFAVGHSGATYEQVVAAADHGLGHATHVFNAMVGLHHRDPGCVGAVLDDDRIIAQIIVDEVHVHPAVVRLLLRVKGVRRTVLISDAMRAAGLPDGDYDLGGDTICVRGGVARTTHGGLAGSTLMLDQALRNVIRLSGLTLVQALPMATSVPAAALGLTERKGSLAAGADADIVLLDESLQVRLTLVAGEVVRRPSQTSARGLLN
ncbi:MAG: N-acetylglucosamine-6-phosphate deacetylase [Anaerolineales bacterium]